MQLHFAYRLRHDGVTLARQGAPYAALTLVYVRAAVLGGAALAGVLVIVQLGLYIAHRLLNLVADRLIPPSTATTRPEWQRRMLLHALGPGLLLGALLAIACERLGLGAWLLCALVLAVPLGGVAHQGAHALSRAHAYGLRSRANWPQVALLTGFAVWVLAMSVTAAFVVAFCRRVVYVGGPLAPDHAVRATVLLLEHVSFCAPPLVFGLWHAHAARAGTPRVAALGIALALATAARLVGEQLQRALVRREGPARHERHPQTPREIMGTLGATLLVEVVVLGILVLAAPLVHRTLGRGFEDVRALLLLLSPAVLAAALSAPLREDLLLRKLTAAELRSQTALIGVTALAAALLGPRSMARGIALALTLGQLFALGLRSMWWLSLRRVGGRTRSEPGAARKSH